MGRGLLTVLELVLDGGLQVEGLDQRRLVERQGVTHTPHVYTLRRHTHAQLWRGEKYECELHL